MEEENGLGGLFRVKLYLFRMGRMVNLSFSVMVRTGGYFWVMEGILRPDSIVLNLLIKLLVDNSQKQ